MSAAFTNNGDGTGTLDLSYTATLANLQKVFDLVLAELWDRNVPPIPTNVDPDTLEKIKVPLVDLTLQQKLDIVDWYIKRIILDMAKSRNVADKQQVVQEPDPDVTI